MKITIDQTQESYVVHTSSNRTRLRMPKGLRRQQVMEEVEASLRQLPGVRAVELNALTGSILVHHAPGPELVPKFAACLQSTAMTVEASTTFNQGPQSPFAALFVNKYVNPNKADSGEPRARNELELVVFDQKRMCTIASVLLLLVGLAKWQKQRSLWSNVPALTLLYWAFDLNWRLSHESQLPSRHAVSSKTSSA